jgi:hypothetical protein
MSDGSTNPTAAPQVPQGLAELYALNGKAMLDDQVRRLSEHDQTYDDGLNQARAQFNKLVTDAQSAANLALLNAVGVADAAAKQGLRHAELAAADQWQEQAEQAGISDDDIAKISQAVTASITATLANMATAAPPTGK